LLRTSHAPHKVGLPSEQTSAGLACCCVLRECCFCPLHHVCLTVPGSGGMSNIAVVVLVGVCILRHNTLVPMHLLCFGACLEHTPRGMHTHAARRGTYCWLLATPFYAAA
jgi:hypothetical protein